MKNTYFVIALSACLLTSIAPAAAQEAPAPPPPSAAVTTPPASPPPMAAVLTTDADADARIDARIDALSKLVEAQQAELTRQSTELQSYRERLDNSEASAALAAAAQDEDVGFEPSVKLYGFLDAGYTRIWGGFFDTGLALSDAGSFVLGNVNVYFDAQPAEQWRALVEVRFTTFPDGAEAFDDSTGTIERISTNTLDHTSAAGGFLSVRWGAIILERAHADYTLSDAFSLRVGYFLTPYGVWNVDHGSPTRIMVRPPFFVSLAIIPERQTGVQAYGRFHALPWELGYHLYLSNGRTLAGVDFDDDKAIGARIYARTLRPIGVTLGASFFTGSSEQFEKTVDLARGTLIRNESIAFDETGIGVDASLDIDALRIRIEGVARRQVYVDGKREQVFGSPRADHFDSGAYLLVAYRLPFLGLEPFGNIEFVNFPTPSFGQLIASGGGGIGVYLSPVATWRTQYDYASAVALQSGDDVSHTYLHILSSRLSVAF